MTPWEPFVTMLLILFFAAPFVKTVEERLGKWQASIMLALFVILPRRLLHRDHR